MKLIPLTKGKHAMVDDDLYPLLAPYKWHVCYDGYAKRNFRGFDSKWRIMFMHHAVAGYPLNKKQVDHIDGNRLNNMKINLRIVTKRQNARNRVEHRKNLFSSRYVGVYWDKDLNKWRAGVTVDKKQIHLGVFLNENDAANRVMEYDKRLKLLP